MAGSGQISNWSALVSLCAFIPRGAFRTNLWLYLSLARFLNYGNYKFWQFWQSLNGHPSTFSTLTASLADPYGACIGCLPACASGNLEVLSSSESPGICL